MPGPCWRRFQRDLRLQRAAERLHRCGPRPAAEFVAELLDAHGVDPAALDRLLTWASLDSGTVVALGADQFPPPPLRDATRRGAA